MMLKVLLSCDSVKNPRLLSASRINSFPTALCRLPFNGFGLYFFSLQQCFGEWRCSIHLCHAKTNKENKTKQKNNHTETNKNSVRKVLKTSSLHSAQDSMSPSWGGYQFPRATITKYCKLGIFRQQNLILSLFWRPEVGKQAISRVGFFWRF